MSAILLDTLVSIYQIQIMQAEAPTEDANLPSRKPQLTSQKAKEPISKGKADMVERVNLYYRYRIASLARSCKHPIYEQLLGTFKPVKAVREQKQSQLEMLDKLVLIKSKYRHRDKINFRRDPLLKLMKFNFEELRNQLKTKKFEELYADLDDEETETKEEKEENKKEFEADPFFGADAFVNYRKKHSIAATTRIFAVGNYSDLSNYLLSEGWCENPDSNSLIYDFKFITKCRLIDTVNLMPHQIVNHFEKSNSITTKYGLCRNIRNLLHLNRDPDVYYPRCFDLHDSSEFQDWVEDFKFTKVVAILKAAAELQDFERNERLLVLCLFLAKRYGIDTEKKIRLIQQGEFPVVSLQEWSWVTGKDKMDPAHYNSITKELQYKGLDQLKDLIAAELGRIQQYDVEYHLNRENIWIVKPASRSRGRGIKAFSELDEILEYIIGRDDIQWVAQKYIENPLIIKKRKFDIRQWVVLSQLKPLTVWMYKECYVRFSAEEYSPSDIKNRFAHLTNNSVAKHSEQFHNDEIKGNMYFENELAELVDSMAGKEVFKGIKKQMRKIITDSMLSVQDMIVPRKNTIEMYGYDFMIDEDFRPYLIEVNSSPCMEYSTHVTAKLVKEGLEGFGKLVCDYMLNRKQIKSTEAYGGWVLIYNK